MAEWMIIRKPKSGHLIIEFRRQKHTKITK